MNKMDAYNQLPILAQNLVCYHEGRKILKNRYGKGFWKYLNEYESRINWSYEQLIEYRDKKLQKLIEHCYETVPYYTRLFNTLGLDYRIIRGIDDLKVLPILTKQDVKDNFDDFISTVIPQKDMVMSHTSGTTGSGFKFYTTKEAINEQWAVWWRYRRNLGIEFNTWCALFGGRSVVPVNKKNPPFYRINSPCKQVYFSNYHMSENNLEWYIYELERRKLKWIHGYPSTINLLANYVLSHDIKLSYKLEHITTGGENLLPSQEERINRAFNIFPYQHYGLSEGTANFSQNRQRDMYVDEDFAAVEFISNREDDSFEVIGTSLSNYAMPLIRYQSGDIARIQTSAKDRLVISIDGRDEDYVTLPNGSKIGRLDHIFKDMINIKEAQIVQRKRDEIILKIVKNLGYTIEDERNLYKESLGRLYDVNIVIEYVDSIPRSSTGKLKFVVSQLPNNLEE